MDLCGHCHCMHFTSKSATSGQGHCTTIAQVPKVNHQHIRQVWCCSRPGAPTCEGWWWLGCSSTKGWRRSQRSSTLNGDFCGSQTIHGGNRIHKDSLANHFRWEVLDRWRSSETRDWSSRSSMSIRRCSFWYTICVSIARWSISENRSPNPRSCKCLFWFLLIYWTYVETKPQKYTLLKLKISTIEGCLADGARQTIVHTYQLDLGSETDLRIQVRELLFDNAYLSKVIVIRNCGTHWWKCLTESNISYSSPPIALGDNRPHRSSFNHSHRRRYRLLLQLFIVPWLSKPLERRLQLCFLKMNIEVNFALPW